MPFIKKNNKTKTNNIKKKITNSAKKQSTPKINNVSIVEQIKQLLKEIK
ncbi:hypothetical protein [Candidatus Phytoplasma fraxini]